MGRLRWGVQVQFACLTVFLFNLLVSSLGKKLTPSKAYLIQLLAAVAGVCISIYLVIQHTRLKTGIQVAPSFCSIGKYADCDAVSISPYSSFLGIPLATYGAVFYFVVLLLGCLAPPKNKNFLYYQRGIAWLALVAIFTDIALLLVQVIMLSTICVMCCLTYLCTLLIAASAGWFQSGKWEDFESFVQKSLFSRRTGDPFKLPVGQIILGVVALGAFSVLVGFIPAIVKSQSKSQAYVDSALEEFYRQWREQRIRQFPLSKNDGVHGPQKAKVQIIVFSDFECPHCRNAAFLFQKLFSVTGDRVQFVFKHFPLDSSCNPAVSYQVHPHACQLAKLSVCAASKGKFWDFHDTVFFSFIEPGENRGADAVVEAVKSGPFKPFFTEAEYRSCLKSDAVNLKILDDIRFGNSFPVKATPSVFINGKPVTIALSVENLLKLIEIEESL